MTDHDTGHSSRERLLAAGKLLFSRKGYEQTSTAAIAREAGTSESQLVRYFVSKSGLLEAIFNEAWSSLTAEITRHVTESAHGRDAVVRICSLVIAAFGRDHDMGFLFLFEGRRVRGNDVVLSQGFRSFYELFHKLIARGQSDGSFRKDVGIDVLGSALLGCAEGMMRDRMIAERSGQPAQFDDAAIQRTFEAVANALGPPTGP